MFIGEQDMLAWVPFFLAAVVCSGCVDFFYSQAGEWAAPSHRPAGVWPGEIE